MHVPRRRLTLARFAPLALTALALPLLAPTCDPAPTGVKAFAKGSLIIPMDQCYQYDGTSTANLAACPATRDKGDVIKAYGLVYQLVRAGIPVYWTIKTAKSALADVDATVQLSGGLPASKYDWTSGQFTGAVGAGTGGVVNYRGGPFVVDASDVDDPSRSTDAKRVLASLKGTFGAATAVNVHQTNVAFTANAAKTMSGGWNAGGAVPPKLALLNIPGGDGRYADHVLEGYLIKSGLAPACVLNNPPCADGSAGTTTGTHGTIYDRLEAKDFMPPACTGADKSACSAGSACLLDSSTPASPVACGPTDTACHCDWKSTNLFRGGYSVLWLPHWTGPNSSEGTLGSGYQCCDSGASGVTCTGSCGNAGSDKCSCVTSGAATLSDAELTLVLRTIGAYSTGGNDVFGECGGIGSLEGIYGNSGASSGGVNGTFGDGDPATQFMATKGLHYNETPNGAIAYNAGYLSSPFMQIGDFAYAPVSGLIDKYRPADDQGSAFRSGVTSLITDTTKTGTKQVDYFTVLAGSETHGNVVYLAGHDYSGFQTSGGATQIAGTRLVLNTLFNLGAKCIAGGACKVPGVYGVCADGQWTCPTPNGARVCTQTVFPTSEVCDGLDNDCDGTADDGLTASFYDGPAGTKDVGVCHAGVKECKFDASATHPGTVVPLTVTSPEVTPSPEQCNGLDDDCNGAIDDGVQARSCYDLPGNGCTQQPDGSYSCKGTCKPGTQACVNGAYGPCQGEVLPARDLCEPETDGNCNGVPGEGCACDPLSGQTRPCYSKSGTAGVGVCKLGHQDCTGNGVWTACIGDQGPQPVQCPSLPGQDNDCDGKPDDCECIEGQTKPCYTGNPADLTQPNATCAQGVQTCAGGKWGACAGEVKPAAVELCDGKDNDCNGQVDEGATCALGRVCVNGACTFATCGVESPCGEGYVCQNAKCVAAPCESGAVCAAGKICSAGRCVDPCASVVCGKGAFCSGGTCVGGGCFATGCPAGELCLDGAACQKDPCAGVACPVGAFCRAGDCVPACAFVACAVGERCGEDGLCAPDACAGITCGAGEVCAAGKCQADACATVTCGDGQVCRNGLCGADACAGVVCPVGHCLDGQCYSSRSPQGFGVAPPTTTPTPGSSGSQPKSGGGCASGGGAAPTALLLLLAAIALRRGPRRGAVRAAALVRRGRGVSAALLVAPLAAALAVGTGCSGGSKQPDPGPTPVACTTQTCGTTCADLAFDAKNCGACGVACGADQICVDSKCGPGSPIGPFVATLTPPSAPRAGSGLTTVDIAGARFQSGAAVRAAGLATPAIPQSQVQFVDDGHLRVQLDLRAASVGPLEIRIVNPDRVASNPAAFSVLVQQPAIAALTPSSVPAGQAMSGPVHVTGSGFVSSSQCRLSGPSLPEQGLATAIVTAGSALDCTVDAVHLAPGSYALTVLSDGDSRSAPATFSVVSPVPTLTSVEPPYGRPGTSQNAASIVGSGFDATSDVQLLSGATVLATFPTTYLSPTQLYVSPLDLTSVNPGSYKLRVVNASGAIASTNQLDFTVTSYPPIVNSTAPSAVRKDSTVTLQVLGANFDASCNIQMFESGAWQNVPTTTYKSATELDATGLSFVGKQPGSYLVRVMSAAANVGASAAMSIAVVSDTAILSSLTSPNPPSVTPAADGSLSVPLTITGANLEASPTVSVARVGGGSPAIQMAGAVAPPLPASPQTLTAALSAADVETGSYAITVKNNANAAASNAVYLSVLPGPPSLASLSPTCAVQSGTVTVNAAGKNLALPDAAGNGGSVVHASFTPAGASAPTEIDLPSCADATRRGNTCATVKSATSLALTLDTTEAVIATYNLSLRNPGQPASGAKPLDVKTTCP
jgi:hypothetical protein